MNTANTLKLGLLASLVLLALALVASGFRAPQFGDRSGPASISGSDNGSIMLSKNDTGNRRSNPGYPNKGG